MICIKCNERIPLLSSISFDDPFQIKLICQCDNENKVYDIGQYIATSKEKKNKISKTFYKCFLHKNQDIWLFCIDCGKDLCPKCDCKGHLKHNLVSLNDLWKNMKNSIKINAIKEKNDFFELLPNELSIQKKENILQFYRIIYDSFLLNKSDFASLRNAGYFESCIFINNSQGDQEKKKPSSCYPTKGRKFLKITKLKGDFEYLDPNPIKIAIIRKTDAILVLNINLNKIELHIKKDKKYLLKEKYYLNSDSIKRIPYNLFCILPTSEYALITFKEGTFKLLWFDNSKEKLIQSKFLYGHSFPVIICTIYNNSILITVSLKDRVINLWELQSLKCIKTFNDLNVTYILGISQYRILSVLKDSKIKIYDFAQHIEYNIESPKSFEVRTIVKAIELFDRKLATLSYDNIVQIFDLNLRIYIGKLEGHKKQITDLIELSSDKNCLTCSDDSSIRVWSIRTFQCLTIIMLPELTLPWTIVALKNDEVITLTRENLLYLIH